MNLRFPDGKYSFHRFAFYFSLMKLKMARTFNVMLYTYMYSWMQKDAIIWKSSLWTVNEQIYLEAKLHFCGYNVCWPCMCGVMFCRYTCWSGVHHVRAQYHLPLWSENGTRRLYCSASTILKSLDICYIHILLILFLKTIIISIFV